MIFKLQISITFITNNSFNTLNCVLLEAHRKTQRCLVFSLQVTLHADDQCRYIAWRRKKLYLLFAKHRYIARIFALIVRSDIAEKVYSLSDKAFDMAGHHYDLRLPSYCHMPGPELERAHDLLEVPVPGERAA